MSHASTEAPAPSSYRELAPRAELGDLLVCRWAQHVRVDRDQRIVPDGCIDVVWRAGRELIVAGPATRATVASLPAGSSTVGVRFAPGAGSGLAGLPLSELRDANVPLAELWGADAAERLAQSLHDAGGVAAQLELLERAVLDRRARAAPADRLVLAAAELSAAATGDVRVHELGDALGVSERQLLRRFQVAVGYGPKTLARVLRFQRFLTAAWAQAGAGGAADGVGAGRSGDGLGRLALDAGYADQAHLSRECRRLTGVSPRELLHGA